MRIVLLVQQFTGCGGWHESCISAGVVTYREALAGLGLVVLLSIPALADLPCQPASVPPVPLTVGMFLDQVLGSLIQNGVAVLFIASVAVVGLPWMMAGLAMALFQLPRRKA